MMKHLILFLVFSFLSGTVLASESSLYDFSWLDKDKEIYVLQNRKFRKDSKLYVGGTLAKTLSGAFVDSYGGTARAGYFFSEDWGIEGVFGKNSGSTNDSYKGVEEQTSVAYYRKVDSYIGAMAMWSPFYSKINTFNKVFYFDWMFGLGLASITTSDNRKEFDSVPSKTLTNENIMGVLWNTGFRFYINDNWSLRLDITGLNYKAQKQRREGTTSGSNLETNKIFGSYDLGLGLNYTF